MRAVSATALLILCASITASSASRASEYGDFSYDEFKCVAKAVWYEGGSSRQSKEEQKLGAYTMIMRKIKVIADPYLKKDWGEPDMCTIIKHPRQYSYHSFSYSRIAPVTGDLWVRAQCKLPVASGYSACLAWETTKKAVQEVMAGLKDGSYAPPEGFENADSYIVRGCEDSDGPEAGNCKPGFRVGDGSRCYFHIALVRLRGAQPHPEHLHAYYRKKTIDEVLATIHDDPPICKNARRTVAIMYSSHLGWIASHGRLEELPPPPIVAPAPQSEPQPAPSIKKKMKPAKKKKRQKCRRCDDDD